MAAIAFADVLALLQRRRRRLLQATCAGTLVVLGIQSAIPCSWRSEGTFRELKSVSFASQASMAMGPLSGMAPPQVPQEMACRRLTEPAIEALGMQLIEYPRLPVRWWRTLVDKVLTEIHYLDQTPTWSFEPRPRTLWGANVHYKGRCALTLDLLCNGPEGYAVWHDGVLLGEGTWDVPFSCPIFSWSLSHAEDLSPGTHHRLRLLPIAAVAARAEEALSLQADPQDRQLIYIDFRWSDPEIARLFLNHVMGGYQRLLNQEAEELLDRSLARLGSRQTELTEEANRQLDQYKRFAEERCLTQGLESCVAQWMGPHASQQELRLQETLLELEQQRLATVDNATLLARRRVVDRELEGIRERLRKLREDSSGLPGAWAEDAHFKVMGSLQGSALKALAEGRESLETSLALQAPRSRPLDLGSVPLRPVHPLLVPSLLLGALVGFLLAAWMSLANQLCKGTPITANQVRQLGWFSLSLDKSSERPSPYVALAFLRRAQAKTVLIAGLEDPAWILNLVHAAEELGLVASCVECDPRSSLSERLERRLASIMEEKSPLAHWTLSPARHPEAAFMVDWTKFIEHEHVDADLVILWTTHPASSAMSQLLADHVDARIVVAGTSETLEQVDRPSLPTALWNG
ncbi:MAG: hypothetical protein ACOYKZ_05560 [Chlamydiia bacterium]